MGKIKYCEVGQHEVTHLWHSRKTDKRTGEVIQQSCCKSCMGKQSVVKMAKTSRKNEIKKQLNVYFASQALVFPARCENCGEYLDQSEKRSQTCHILPKSIFKTVATHPANKIFMCCFSGCYGHAKFDDGDSKTRMSMPVYSLAVERFKSFENDLYLKDKIRAYKYLGLDISELV